MVNKTEKPSQDDSNSNAHNSNAQNNNAQNNNARITNAQHKQPAQKNNVWLKLVLMLALVLLGLMLFQNFNKDESPRVKAVSKEGVITKIQNLSRLETVAYNVDTVITSEQQGTWQQLWQDKQKGLFIARGKVVAGVDLSDLHPSMVKVSNPTEAQIEAAKTEAAANGNENLPITLMPNIMITLPPAEIFSVYLDDVQVYDWEAGGFFGMVNAEPKIFEQAQASAKKEVLDRACADGVLQQAEANAKKEMQQLFAMTGAEVTVNTQGVGACKLGN